VKITMRESVACDVTAMFVFARTTSLALTVFFIATVILASTFLLLTFRSGSLRKTDLLRRALELSNWTNWTIYIPIVGGVVCIFIGILELAWKPCVTGLVAIAVGGIRLWSKRKMRRALRDRIGSDNSHDIC
jgi:hypothetical protein